MSVEVDIYMTNLTKFFKENPVELTNLVPESKKEEFFEEVKKQSSINVEKGDDASLTRNQFIQICVKLNGVIEISEKNLSNLIVKTEFGEYSLN